MDAKTLIGRLTAAGIRVLSALSRRLGTPAHASVPASAVILTRLPCVAADERLEDVAQMFVGGRNAELPVVADGRPIAVVTKHDVALGLEQIGPHAPISDAPSHDVVMVTPSDSLADVLERLRGAPECVAVVVDHGAPVGVLTFDRIAEYMRRPA